MHFTDEQGRVWEFRGEYRPPVTGDHFLERTARDAVPDAGIIHSKNPVVRVGDRAIVYPVGPEHVFGGVVFEETGEERTAKTGEAYLGDDGLVWLAHAPTFATKKILRPVRLVEDKE